MDLTCDEEMLPEDETPIHPEPLPRAIDDGQLLPTGFQLNPAIPQPDILDYPELLDYMLQNDKYNIPDPYYFTSIQTEITLDMRRTVVTWMFEVCEEEQLTDSVFARATNIMDRFLSVHKIEKNQFQLLGATCLLLSSKWSGSVLSTDRLVFFTAHSITTEMLHEWEFLIMFQIDWDIYCLTPNEFIEPFFHKLPQNYWDPVKLKEQIRTYTAFCATDYSFSIYTPSIIASASFAAALQSQLSQEIFEDILSQLQSLAKVQKEVLRNVTDELLSKLEIVKLENSLIPGKESPGIHEEPDSADAMEDSSILDKLEELGELEQAETPTDVRDIEF